MTALELAEFLVDDVKSGVWKERMEEVVDLLRNAGSSSSSSSSGYSSSGYSSSGYSSS